MQLLFRKFPFTRSPWTSPDVNHLSKKNTPFQSYAAGEFFYDSIRTGEFFSLCKINSVFFLTIIIIIIKAFYDFHHDQVSERFLFVFCLRGLTPVCVRFSFSIVWASTTVTVSWLVLDFRRNGRSHKDVALDPD